MTTATMQAFHGSEEIKKKYLDRIAQHRELDNLIQGETGCQGKGCAVWCTLNEYKHSSYETELGIPQVLARLEDGIFEGLSKDDSQKWPERFLSAIRPGADLSGVWDKFAFWLLTEELKPYLNDKIRPSVEHVAELYRRKISGEEIIKEEWQKARYAAAAYAADTYAAAAYAAEAYADAAYAAEAYAEATAYAAYAAAAYTDADAVDADAAKRSARARQADKLEELLKAC